MIEALYQSAAAADGMQAWNDLIARNIAGATVPGFKKVAVSFDGVMAGTVSLGATMNPEQVQARIAPQGRAVTSFVPGDLRRTGDPLEFAIDGPGFFKLQREDGTQVYTRDGQFRVASDGRLVSKEGYEVTGESGGIQLLIDGGPLTVDPEGRVMQGDQEVGTLTVYLLPEPANLQRTTGGFVIDPQKPQFAQPAEGVGVHQGFLEASNVSAIREMAEIVTVSNALQANQKMIQSLDELSERAVQMLGPPAA